MKKYRLEIIVFLSGAIEMGLELLASRILSPYVGSSNVVWTSIIGIILASMSLGYWYGGKIADKTPSKDKISEILLMAVFFTSLIPLFETIVVKNMAELVENLIFSAIICAITVFSIPSFLLAMISPIAVKIKSMDSKEIGLSSGKISSLSTLGSIIGTFFMGFVLIPHIGVSNINIGIIVLLILMSIIIRETKDKKYMYLCVFSISISIITVVAGKIVFTKIHPDLILDTDSEYSRIWVTNLKSGDQNYKVMQVDTGIESWTDVTKNELSAEYLKFYDLFEYYNKSTQNTLMIGGAAYTYPMYYLNKYKNKKIDVVEIDEKMTQIAEKEFGLNLNEPRIKVYTQDGRSFLNQSNNKYDTILIDAFKGLNAPFELTTYEALQNAKNLLNDNGIVLTNIISGITGKNAKFLEHEYATYKKVFDDVKVFKVKSKKTPEEKQNLILLGIKGRPDIDESKYQEYSKRITSEIINYNSNSRIATDDFAPIGK